MPAWPWPCYCFVLRLALLVEVSLIGVRYDLVQDPKEIRAYTMGLWIAPVVGGETQELLRAQRFFEAEMYSGLSGSLF